MPWDPTTPPIRAGPQGRRTGGKGSWKLPFVSSCLTSRSPVAGGPQTYKERRGRAVLGRRGGDERLVRAVARHEVVRAQQRIDRFAAVGPVALQLIVLQAAAL